MSKDRIQYLEDAIRNADKQIEMLKLNRRYDPNLLENLHNQKLHFQQELINLKSNNNASSNKGMGFFGIMDILDDEDVIKLPEKKDDSKS